MFGIERVSKRFIGGTAIATLVLGTGFAAEAATAAHKKIVRHASFDYQGGCAVDVSNPAVTGTASPGTCVVGEHYDITRQAGEKYLTISVTDQTGRPVGGEIWISDGTGTGDATNQPVCGELKNYRMGQASYSLDLNTSVAPACPGAATSGSIAVTYSSYRLK